MQADGNPGVNSDSSLLGHGLGWLRRATYQGGTDDGVPPAKASRGQTLVTEPEALAIVDQGLDRRAPSVAEDKDRASERILPERIFAEPN